MPKALGSHDTFSKLFQPPRLDFLLFFLGSLDLAQGGTWVFCTSRMWLFSTADLVFSERKNWYLQHEKTGFLENSLLGFRGANTNSAQTNCRARVNENTKKSFSRKSNLL